MSTWISPCTKLKSEIQTTSDHSQPLLFTSCIAPLSGAIGIERKKNL